MDQAIQTTVTVELVGTDEAPGVVEGGVLSQETREVTIEALPGDIPDSIKHDVSALEMNATLTVEALTAPEGVTVIGDLEAVIATITPPSAEPSEDEIETETELVGEGGEQPTGEAEGDTAEEAAQSEADSGEES